MMLKMESMRTLSWLVLVAARLSAGAAGAQDERGLELPEEETTRQSSRSDERTEEYFGARWFRLTASTGFDYSSGDFGTPEDTGLLYVPVGMKLEWDPFVFRVTVPYVRIDGDIVPVGGAPEVAPGFTGVRSGVGDVVVSATWVYYPEIGLMPVAELTGKIKFGSADENQGLGTGETDFTMQLDLSKRFGRVTPFAAVGYKVIGNPPGLALRNKLFVYGGATMRLSDHVNGGIAFDWSQSSVAGRDDFRELSPFMTFKLGRRVALDPYAVIGLSDTSPDWGFGMQIRFITDIEFD